MGPLRRWANQLVGFFSPARYRFDSPPRPIDLAIAEMMGNGRAPRVGRVEALSVSAVQRGRNLVCSVATLPLIQRAPDRRVVRHPLLEQFDPDVANVVTWAQIIEDLVFEATSWCRITEWSGGYPSKARHLEYGTVSVDPPEGRSPAPLPSGMDPRAGVVYVDGEPVSGAHIIRFDSPNPGVLKAGGRAIKRAILLDQAAAMYASDPRPLDYFTPHPEAEEISDDEAAIHIAKWIASRRKRATGWIPRAMIYNSVDTPSPADLQLVQLQQRAGLDIANSIGVDPEELGISTTSRTYANAVDRRRDKINDVLSPYMKAITDRLSMGDITRRGYTVLHDLDDYMRANPTERVNYYREMVAMGAMDPEEVREEEGMSRRRPSAAAASNVVPIRPPAGAPAALQATGTAAAWTFDREEPLVTNHGQRLGHPLPSRSTYVRFLDASGNEFSVDLERRTIEGLNVPYGRDKIGYKYGRKFRFLPGAIQWGDLSRIKLMREHLGGVGVAIEAHDTPNGLRAKFRVAHGPAGDEALLLAAEGVLDGLSVGVDFEIDVDTRPDPLDPTVDLVYRAIWRETSLTPLPAFDDARVTRVAASRSQGDAMPPCNTCGAPHAAGVACANVNPPGQQQTPPAQQQAPAQQQPALAQFSAEQTAVLAQLGLQPAAAAAPAAPAGAPAATFTLDQLPALVQLFAAQAPVSTPEQRQIVNPTRNFGSNVDVIEPAPYRFDRKGNLHKGSHEFSADIISGLRDGDQGAYDRAMGWVRAQFDVLTTDVNELNPTRNRPEMYVDQRSFRYPVWSAIDKGSLDDVTPFTFPKFSSAAGLVGNHTEGVEPTSGTFVVTNQTVTPTPTSGKAKITRETWDQGGNPQTGDLIWRQMKKGWFEALEAAAVAALDAVTPTQITLTAGGGTTGQTLAAELKAAMAALAFVRGGFAFDDAFAQIDLYKALVGARDGQGRALFPAIGPSNADGTVSNRVQSVDVNGVPFLPAWALAATGSVPASSYLFDSDSVFGWASAPQRLQMEQHEVAHVYIGIWGYKATAISDLTGVREIVYDPVP